MQLIFVLFHFLKNCDINFSPLPHKLFKAKT